MCDFCSEPSPIELAKCRCNHTYCSNCAAVSCSDDDVFNTCSFCPWCMPTPKPNIIKADNAPPPPQQEPVKPPKEFICPITLEIMGDPVVLTDGFSYERLAIREWLRSNNISPMTGAVVKRKFLANTTLRTLINDWRAQHGI